MLRELKEELQKGDWQIVHTNEEGHFTEAKTIEEATHFLLCDGRGQTCFLAIRGKSELSNGASWSWDGNFESPTLNPSIWDKAPNGWHGWLREGKLVDA